MQTFADFEAVREFMETSLRRPARPTAPLGPCADSAAATTSVHGGSDALRFEYTGTPVALLPPASHWGMLDRQGGGSGSGAAGTAAAGRWVLAFTRDRAEAPELAWRLIESTDRRVLDRQARIYPPTPPHPLLSSSPLLLSTPHSSPRFPSPLPSSSPPLTLHPASPPTRLRADRVSVADPPLPPPLHPSLFTPLPSTHPRADRVSVCRASPGDVPPPPALCVRCRSATRST